MTEKETIKQLKTRLGLKDVHIPEQTLKVIINTYNEVRNDKVVYPFDSERFLDLWSKWVNYKKVEHNFKYKSIYTLQASLTQLGNLSNNDEDVACKIIMQSLENGWKGFFNLKNNSNGTKDNGSNRISDSYKRSIADDLFTS